MATYSRNGSEESGTMNDQRVKRGSVTEFIASAFKRTTPTPSHSTAAEDGVSSNHPDKSAQEKFFQAAETGDLLTLKSLIDSNAVDFDAEDSSRRSAAHYAAFGGHVNILEYLNQLGLNLAAADASGRTPFSDALACNHVQCIEYLKELQVDQGLLIKNLSKEEFGRLQARGIIEKWAIDQNDFEMTKTPFARGAGGELYKVMWRGLECVGKTCGPETNAAQMIFDLGNEISLMATLRHPNLVMFLGACFQVNPPILLMEFCSGGTLEEYLLRATDSGKYVAPMTLRFRFLLELAIALNFLHRCSPPVVHRDLKPSNVLLTSDYHIKVTDFGLSKFIPSKNKKLGDKFVMTGETGSYRYMAPEVFKHMTYDVMVDVYSFSLIAFWIVTGLRPFIAVQDAVKAATKAAVENYRPDISMLKNMPKTSSLIQKCWKQEPSERPTFDEVVKMIRALENEFPKKRSWFG